MTHSSKTLAVALALGLALPAAAAPAAKTPSATSGVTGDVRCLLTMAALGQDKQRQQAALIGAYFFVGRINARAPGFNLPAAVKAEEPKMSGPVLAAESQRCGPMVEAAVHELQASFPPPPGAPPPAAPGAAAVPPPAAPK